MGGGRFAFQVILPDLEAGPPHQAAPASAFSGQGWGAGPGRGSFPHPPTDCGAAAQCVRFLKEIRGLAFFCLFMTAAESRDEQIVQSDDDVRTLEETARFFARSVPTVRGWIADNCPVVQRGSNGVAYRLSLRAVAEWLRERDAAAARAEEEKAARDAQLKLELLGEDALARRAGLDRPLTPTERAAMLSEEVNFTKLAQLRRELVSADEMQTQIARAFATINAQLRAAPDRLAARFGWDEEAIQAVGGEIETILHDLADAVAGMELVPAVAAE